MRSTAASRASCAFAAGPMSSGELIGMYGLLQGACLHARACM